MTETLSNLVNSKGSGLNEVESNIAIFNRNIDSLLYRDKWATEDNQFHSDLFYLVQYGVPDSLRSVVWRELLKVKIIEIE